MDRALRCRTDAALLATACAVLPATWTFLPRTVASFLLGNTGHPYFYFSPGRGQPATVDSPLYHLRIGRPSGWYSLLDGVYQRWFSNGRVLVNPSGSTVTVPLDTTYQEPDGTLTAVVTMPPHTGRILTLPLPASMMS